MQHPTNTALPALSRHLSYPMQSQPVMDTSASGFYAPVDTCPPSTRRRRLSSIGKPHPLHIAGHLSDDFSGSLAPSISSLALPPTPTSPIFSFTGHATAVGSSDGFSTVPRNGFTQSTHPRMDPALDFPAYSAVLINPLPPLESASSIPPLPSSMIARSRRRSSVGRPLQQMALANLDDLAPPTVQDAAGERSRRRSRKPSLALAGKDAAKPVPAQTRKKQAAEKLPPAGPFHPDYRRTSLSPPVSRRASSDYSDFLPIPSLEQQPCFSASLHGSKLFHSRSQSIKASRPPSSTADIQYANRLHQARLSYNQDCGLDSLAAQLPITPTTPQRRCLLSSMGRMQDLSKSSPFDTSIDGLPFDDLTLPYGPSL